MLNEAGLIAEGIATVLSTGNGKRALINLFFQLHNINCNEKPTDWRKETIGGTGGQRMVEEGRGGQRRAEE